MVSRRNRRTPALEEQREMRVSRAQAVQNALSVAALGMGSAVFGVQRAQALEGGSGGMSLIDPGEPSGGAKAMDFLQQLKIELVGAKEEFEELPPQEAKRLMKEINPVGAEKAFFALGCYWGAEATFRCTRGVVGTRVGFMGGKQPAPFYENTKDHLEAIEVTYTGGDETYERLLKVCGRTFDFVDVGPRYQRKIWPASSGQSGLATKRGQTWSSMPVADASSTFFTPAKLDHQAYSKPRCDAAAPNVQLVLTGMKRKIDHYHYSVDCPTCTLPGPEGEEKANKRI